MTGRERIEQAAKEHGWAIEQPSPIYAPLMFKYTKEGHYPELLIYDVYGDLDAEVIVTVDQVIANLQQHKEQP